MIDQWWADVSQINKFVLIMPFIVALIVFFLPEKE